MSCGSIVAIETVSDADFAEAFQWKVGDEPFDFTDHNLMMMIRRNPDDAEVMVALDTYPPEVQGDIPAGFGGIMFNDPDGEGKITTFNIFILRDQMRNMVPGEYVHSLLLVRPDGIREDIWHGTLTHSTGPTR